MREKCNDNDDDDDFIILLLRKLEFQFHDF